MIESKENRESHVKLSGKCPLCGNEIKEDTLEHVEKRQNEEKELAQLKSSKIDTAILIQKTEKEEKEGAHLAEVLKQ